jgi:hypothetical protein
MMREECIAENTGPWRTSLGTILATAVAVCFNRPSADDPSLWPSDHAGVWADLTI